MTAYASPPSRATTSIIRKKLAEHAAAAQRQEVTQPESSGGGTGKLRSISGRAEASTSGPASPNRKPRPAASWEQDIAVAEAQLALIDAEMLDPQLSSHAEKLAELQGMRDAAQQKLDELYSGWLSEADM
ncbi:ABC transporter C-terminal domain-containing protein [Paenibacillus rhizoplanae]